jgi:hypothetical protein
MGIDSQNSKKNKQMKNYKASEPCLVCGESRDGFVCYHHVYSRKAFSEYSTEKWNLMPLCRAHHNEAHSLPDHEFAKKYKRVADWLEFNNWFIQVNGKYFHEEPPEIFESE